MTIDDIRKYGVSAKGRKEIIKYYAGQQLTAKGSIHGKCYECMNGYSDGKMDCVIPDCPLYPFMPYREGEKRVMRKMTAEEKIKISKKLLKGKRMLSRESTSPTSH